MKLIYNIDIKDLKFLEEKNARVKLKNKYQDLFLKCKDQNNIKNILIKIENTIYRLHKLKNYKYEPDGFCDGCNFKKECWDKLDICVLTCLFEKNTDHVLKKVEEYELVFGSDIDE